MGPEKAAKDTETAKLPKARPTELKVVTPAKPIDLHAPELYLNRELTWLAFNERVLHEAEDPRTPLLERVKFLAIIGSNLDEFFMKRIGGLKQQLGAGLTTRSIDGRTPREQITECQAKIRHLEKRQQALISDVTAELREHDIILATYDELSSKQRKVLRQYYIDNVFPLVTPQAMDPAHPFPFVSNLSLNLLVTPRPGADYATTLCRVKVPLGSGVPRFVRAGEEHVYARLEDVMADNLDLLFPDMDIESCELFRVTRNANTEKDEEQADDLMAMIESELRERRFAPIVRMEVAPGLTPLHRGKLSAEFGLDEDADVFEMTTMLGPRDLFDIAGIKNPSLRDPPHRPHDHPKLLDNRSIFHTIRDEKSILLHHPHHSFGTSVERLLKEASEDPKVRAIKMTLYRTAPHSKVVEHLTNAARLGKQVAVVVELKARFDEAANIRWASRLEEVGIHVTYGVVGLKTHCKVLLVVRGDHDGLRRYVHMATGNYHSGTARIYSDLGLLTTDPDIGHDASELFNYLTTGYKPKRDFKKLLVAPKLMKRALLDFIAAEVEHQKAGRAGKIQLKTNALEDKDVTRALYRASQEGVEIDLIVRDSCRLRAGIPGLSDNIRIISIVGRFLEHARIYYFKNGGDERYYIGSADLMSRNLGSRVEALVPIEAPDARMTVRTMLDLQVSDQRAAWEMQPDGTYLQRVPKGDGDEVCAQDRFIELAAREHKEAKRLRKRQTRTLSLTGRRQ